MAHIKKITHGYVIQTWDTDLQCCINQNFVAGDLVEYEDSSGNPIDPEDGEATRFLMDHYEPYRMKDPDDE